MPIQYWYDMNQRHKGTIRIIDPKKKMIFGSDPTEDYWVVRFARLDSSTLMVDFSTKSTHKGKTFLMAKLANKGTQIHWDDGNIWFRIGHDPNILLSQYARR